MREYPAYSTIRTVEELKNYEALYNKVLKIAQFQSELDLGVNPKNFDQADVSNLSEKDADYIDKVSALVESRLNDTTWISSTLKAIEEQFRVHKEIHRGIRFDDELFKVGRGILENHLEKLEKENQ